MLRRDLSSASTEPSNKLDPIKDQVCQKFLHKFRFHSDLITMDRSQPYKLQVVSRNPTNVVEAVDYLIAGALKTKASDIHLGVNHTDVVPEPFLLRLRAHGKLQLIRSEIPHQLYQEIIGRFKV